MTSFSCSGSEANAASTTCRRKCLCRCERRNVSLASTRSSAASTSARGYDRKGGWLRGTTDETGARGVVAVADGEVSRRSVVMAGYDGMITRRPGDPSRLDAWTRKAGYPLGGEAALEGSVHNGFAGSAFSPVRSSRSR